jgi:hypothetical protein
MHSDHFHPGWRITREAATDPKFTTAAFVFSGAFNSSGLSKDFFSRFAITHSLFISFLIND